MEPVDTLGTMRHVCLPPGLGSVGFLSIRLDCLLFLNNIFCVRARLCMRQESGTATRKMEQKLKMKKKNSPQKLPKKAKSSENLQKQITNKAGWKKGWIFLIYRKYDTTSRKVRDTRSKCLCVWVFVFALMNSRFTRLVLNLSFSLFFLKPFLSFHFL